MNDWEKAWLAHISEDGARVQTIREHLTGTAKRAQEFARPFGGQEQAYLAGELHDIGKYSRAFQRRLRGAAGRVDHSTAGAQEAFRMNQPEVVFAIAGHHGGMPDFGTRTDAGTDTLFGRLHNKALESYDTWKSEVHPQPAARPRELLTDKFSAAFYTRMLFSCLVDADYLDTEAFMRGGVPRGGYPEIPALLQRLKDYVAPWRKPSGALNAKRSEILDACFKMGEHSEPGLYTLTAPTGSGKTVSSLAFALSHAAAHHKSRVIYVIPYTSIIDQTAETFREILGDDPVIEHHSGTDWSMPEGEMNPALYRKSLAAENWDAPVIVTTAVQFFESLFSNRPSRCRKLHNIAGSVVIFDEAQTLPVGYLRPCVAAIGQLVRHYGATAVLCTATQPALEPLFDELAPGLKAKEICPDPQGMYQFFRRTTLQNAGELTEEALARMLNAGGQALCVVNRRAMAQQLFDMLEPEGRYCLTTLLCPADRKRLLAEIRQRLKDKKVCRVVSTSLIEAGVDVDFPAVWREEAGLDSILQTAGRCNREGRRSMAESIVTIFRLAGQRAPAMIRPNVDAACSVLDRFSDPAALEAIHAYFDSFMAIKGNPALDFKEILPTFEHQLCPFDTVNGLFHLIESPTTAIYIPVDGGSELVERLRRGETGRKLYRQLDQYAVNVYDDHLDRLRDAGVLEPAGNGNYILTDLNAYSRETGLAMDVETGIGWLI